MSVIIPCYNAGRYLAAALSSVRSQTRTPDEIIVVDDASTDNSAAIPLDGVRVVRFPVNRGVAAARNEGLRTARGEFVAWLDADDLWQPEHLERVVPLLEDTPEAVLAFSRTRIFGNDLGDEDWPVSLPAGQAVHAFEECIRRCIVPQNSVVVRREAVLAAGGYDERLRQAEDFELWLRLAHANPFICTHDVTTLRRRHASQASACTEQYWKGEYEARRWFLASRRAEGDPSLERMEELVRSVWLHHLDVAWWNRRTDWFDFHLARAAEVPGSELLLPELRRRRRLVPLARAWDIMPTSVRRGLRWSVDLLRT